MMISRRLPSLCRTTGHSLRQQWCRAWSTTAGDDRMRIAVVGGGASGLSAALHMAPLVENGLLDGPIDVYDASPEGYMKGREIGVGLWSTALDPFQKSPEESHQLVYDELIHHGSFVRDVGYRTPRGHWLAKSRLEDPLPNLLFLREKDMLGALRKGVSMEESRGTIRLHPNSMVDSVYEDSDQPWSAPLVINNAAGDLVTTERDYHLIVAADGVNSVLRRLYGGHSCHRGPVAPSPLEIPTDSDGQNWFVTTQAEATDVQDRQYTVFRGNAVLTSEDVGKEPSFQSWGEGKSMRFATVPMKYPTPNGTEEERQVWFITIEDPQITDEQDPVKRRELLLDAFKNWHDPVCRLVEATPPEEILMERAVAHRHSLSPVANFNSILFAVKHKTPRVNGNGPALSFSGDAFMTVDPILAQGFTIGMEGGPFLRKALQASMTVPPRLEYPYLSFDPFALREEMRKRHDGRLSRLIHLLRATELVQALGQPSSGTLSGMVNFYMLRPLMRCTPDAVKRPIFNSVLKYSLGVSD
eukprot:Nitzschia sp. Nitz4//scaffold81_size91200//26828//28408//NITZ4_004981-RA/size91200-processed-gene-0.121-mRNA-1//-1//CDS//3329558695//6461//frame0